MAKFLSCENTADALLNAIASNPGLLARLQSLAGAPGQVTFTNRVILNSDTSIQIPDSAKMIYIELTGGGGGGAAAGTNSSGGGGSGGETTWRLFRRSDFQTHITVTRTGSNGGEGEDGATVAVYGPTGAYLLQAQGGKKGTASAGGAAVGLGEGMGAAGGAPSQPGWDSVKGGGGGSGYSGSRGGASRANDQDHGQGGAAFQEGKDFGGGGGFGAPGGKPGIRVWTW